jgi:hypothetical protein
MPTTENDTGRVVGWRWGFRRRVVPSKQTTNRKERFTMKILKRQGDILLEKIDELPDEGATPFLRRKVVTDGVIARGEATGHAHVLRGATLFSQGGFLYAVAEAEGAVVHDEHEDLELEPGVWLVRNQTEYVGEGEQVNVYD